MRLPNRVGPWYFLFLFALATLVRGSEPSPDLASMNSSLLRGSAGPFQVASDTSSWYDDARGRTVPIKLYYPTGIGAKRCPAIIFSHGLGGSRDGYAYLGHRWASYGILSVHPQHPGSDEDVWRGKIRPLHALKSSFEDPANLQARVADLQFVVDRLEKHVAENSPLGQMIDAERIGVGGHAFGALAALALAGQHASVLEMAETGPDRRIKAVLALSSPILFDGLDYGQAYGDIRIPVLHMTGTNDDSPVGPTRAPHRRIPFDNIHGADQFLITFSGADHLTFSGHLRDRAAKDDPYFQNKIAAASTAFWLGYLADSPQLQTELAAGGIDTLVGSIGRVEYKASGEVASSSQRGRTPVEQVLKDKPPTPNPSWAR